MEIFWGGKDPDAHCDCNQVDGHFVKELNMCPLADGWVHCLKNHNVITMYPLGK